ncbi:MAG: type IV secretion protein DotH, partial [Alphaproteobacteria bacterium]|nr:type IV secretion protein DotH [Alphaproteobacteria bacterium]
REFMQRNEDSQRNAVPPHTGTPKPVVSVENLSLDPGVDPPMVNVAAGYVTTITLLDASGQPWPISDVGVGGNFEVSPTASGTHVVRITPLTRFGNGNLSVLLKNLNTPVIFRLVSGIDKVHLRYDARIPQLGPEAKVPLIDKIRLVAGDEIIMAFLDNVPPNGSKRIKVSGVDYRTLGWEMDGRFFVRTPLKLLSPAWDHSVTSSDGTTVYQLNDMAPVLLLSDSGIMTRARLSQENSDDQP